MMHMRLVRGILFSFILVFATAGMAESIRPPETYNSLRIWLAIPSGAFLGFGIGHAVQSRYEDYGWVFTLVDSAAIITGLSVLGDCRPQDTACEDHRTQRADVATALWTASKIVQVTDLSVWSYKYYNKFHSTTFLAPSKSGLTLVTSISF